MGPYLIAGNQWLAKSFEKAGFKNAIIGKEWPENDSTMSLEDARFSVIRYFASDIENALDQTHRIHVAVKLLRVISAGIIM